MSNNNYDPWTLPWLSIVNYPRRDASREELQLVIEKVQQQIRESGPESVSVCLHEAVRFEKARSDILVTLVQATYDYRAVIRGWDQLLSRVEAELARRKQPVYMLLGVKKASPSMDGDLF